MFIIHFLEYTISGWLYFIWLILMLTFSLACLGVVGDKVSKKRLKELSERREKEAEEEYEKAHELVEKQIQNSLRQEVSSQEIGELVMKKLKGVDEIAYVRFASVYRQFKDVTNFIKLITEM